jgi:hypothetical protein
MPKNQMNALPRCLALEFEHNAARAQTRLNQSFGRRVMWHAAAKPDEKGNLLRGERDRTFSPPAVPLTGFLRLALLGES